LQPNAFLIFTPILFFCWNHSQILSTLPHVPQFLSLSPNRHSHTHLAHLNSRDTLTNSRTHTHYQKHVAKTPNEEENTLYTHDFTHKSHREPSSRTRSSISLSRLGCAWPPPRVRLSRQCSPQPLGFPHTHYLQASQTLTGQSPCTTGFSVSCHNLRSQLLFPFSIEAGAATLPWNP